MFAQIAQERGQHCGGLGTRIVQQQDTLANRLQPPDQQLELHLRRHRFPVAGPEVGAEHRVVLGLDVIEQFRRGLEIRETEERRGTRPARYAGECGVVGVDAAVDFLLSGGKTDPRQIAVRPGVMADRMSLGGDPLDHRRHLVRALADHEEGGVNALVAQCLQHGGGGRGRAVVEGQHDLLVVERQRLREALGADARILCGIDGEDARGPERPRARAVRRVRGRAEREQDDEGRAEHRRLCCGRELRALLEVHSRPPEGCGVHRPKWSIAPRVRGRNSRREKKRARGREVPFIRL
jgi:hypothetical protein